jgi:hypothetical protein
MLLLYQKELEKDFIENFSVFAD